jgi:hypothetical protein
VGDHHHFAWKSRSLSRKKVPPTPPVQSLVSERGGGERMSLVAVQASHLPLQRFHCYNTLSTHTYISICMYVCMYA